MITFVYAQEKNGGIGFQNDLPWHLPNDLKFFKETTMGHTMVMGRKTFESMGQRLLPGRKSVVLTSNPSYGEDIEDLLVVNSKDEVLEIAQDEHIMIIGGAGVFLTFMDDADQIIRTYINHSFPYDTQMPDLNPEIWELVKIVDGEVDEKNPYEHRYEWWLRKDRSH